MNFFESKKINEKFYLIKTGSGIFKNYKRNLEGKKNRVSDLAGRQSFEFNEQYATDV